MPDKENNRLDSWKEIASYLGRDDRTAMRWASLGMPVHHSPGAKRGRVFAYVQEIDDWLSSPSPPLRENDAEHKGQQNVSVAEQAVPAATVHGNRGIAYWAGAAVLVAGLGLAAWFVRTRLAAQPAQFRVERNTLKVLDSSGRNLWSHRFEFPLAESVYSEAPITIPPWQLARSDELDLDGGGNRDFLFVVRADSLGHASFLTWFDHRGRIRCTYQPSRPVVFGAQEFDPPFSVDFFQVYEHPVTHQKSVWVVAHHLPDFPSVVVKLDASGHILAEYWHAGHVRVLAQGRVAGREVVLAGATNNEQWGASLSVLDFANPNGSSPAATDKYRCRDCPSGQPLAYLVFPRGEMSRVLNSRPAVNEIWVRENGEIDVSVEAGEAPSGKRAAESYRFDNGLHLLSAEITDPYAMVYAELRERGVVTQPLDRRRASEALTSVRYWNGSAFTNR